MGNCLKCWSASGSQNVTQGSSHSSTTQTSISNFLNNGKGRSNPRSEANRLPSPNLKVYTYSSLKQATHDFDDEGLLGEGGFGRVFRGWIHPQTLRAGKPGRGIPVAVKKLMPNGSQGHKEWLSEVNFLGQLHHPNLVKLIGYCQEGENRLLVYEYMARGSLESYLFGPRTERLPWGLRMKIATDAARGLAFLHECPQPVIYRDLKSANILLDLDFNAKLSDFGLAREGPTGDQSHVSTQVMGTKGYAAPEYIQTGHLTAKCDVFSFGIVLLELISGRRAIDESQSWTDRSLLNWAKRYVSNTRRLNQVVDPKLEGKYSQRGAYMMVLLAMQCVGEASQRPPMQEVVSVLEMLSNGERIEWSEMYPGSSSGSKTPHLAPSQSAITR